MYRVTEIIQNVLETGDLPDEWYLQRGIALHACIALELQKKKYKTDERLGNYLVAAKKWIKDFKPEIIFIEQKLECERFNLCGTPDLVCKLGNTRHVVDFKTNQISWWHKYQLGGYALLLKENLKPVLAGMIVALKDDGTYKIEQHNDVCPIMHAFRAMVTVYNIKKTKQ